ncbi:tape measure protein [Acinetobacter lwoffii]|uniref:Transglycosylase SLT domain-containing protein n=1 Tax=Acinetobacter lwoffii TaxID=28090 RepID=A0A6N1MS67_ACILW|nr:tape measure protein [Acinetobacter lwoffii]QKU20692.1 transglycosylase SLT domain-containing protein [Acinetobacter lwoffii]
MSDSDILSRISILLDANTASFETGMQGARETATTEFGHISSAAKNMAITVAGAFAADKIIDAADGYTQIGSRIKRSTADAEEYAMVQARILETANQTYRPLVEAQETYLATSAGLKEMGKSTADALDIIDSLSYAYTMNAASTEQVASANEWLSKSMIDNKVSGDAFKSMTLAADNLIQDLADHTGKSTIEIKKLGNAGKISLKDLMDTLQGTVDKNKALAAEMPNSWKDGITAVENNFNSFIGKANETYEITGILSGGLITLSEHMEELAIVATAAGSAYGAKRILEYADAVKLSIVQNIARAQALAVERQALVSGAAAEVSRTAAIATNMQAQVAAAQADALRLTGMQRIAFVERTLIPLQAAATVAKNAEAAASRAHTAALGAEVVASSRLAVAKRALMGLVGGPVGLISLGVGLAATMYMVSKSGDQANETLDNQSKYAGLAADQLDRLEGAQRRAAKDELSKEIDIQSLGIKKLENDFELLTESIMDGNKSNKDAARIYAELRAGAIDVGEAFNRLNKLESISSAEINKASELHGKWKEMNVTLVDSKTKLDTVGTGVKNVARDAATATAAIFNLNDEIDKLFKQADSSIITSTATAAMASKGYDDKLIGIINKYLQVEGAIYKNAEGRNAFHAEIQEKINAEYLALMKQDQAVQSRNEKEKERAKILEQQGKILQINAKVSALADKYNFAAKEEKANLPRGLIAATIMQESKGNTYDSKGRILTSESGAQGVAQFMPDTAKRFNVNVADVNSSADGIVSYYKVLLKRYSGNLEKAISAYHAGEGNVDKGTNIGPVNRQYVKNVKGYIAGANGMTPSADFNIDDLMKAQDEYLQYQEQQAEKRKQLELDVADYETQVRTDLADRKAEIDAAGFDDEKTSKLKVQYERWADLDIAAFKDAQNEKLSALSDYLKSDEQLAIQHHARRLKEIERDRDLTTDQKIEAILLLDQQRDHELKNIQLETDRRIFESRKAFMTTSEIMLEHYRLEREEIERTTKDVKERDAAIAASYKNEDRDYYSERDNVWGDYQNVMGVDTSAEDDRSDREAVFQAALDWKLITQEDYQRRMIESERDYHRARANMQLQWGMSYVQGAAGVMAQVFGEQSTAYQAMFAMQKALAIAEVYLNAPKTYSSVLASASTIPVVGPFIAPGLAAGAVALQMAQAAMIGSVSFNPVGMAHDGIDRIPEEGSWWLNKGERVLTDQTSAKLDRTLEDVRQNNGSRNSGNDMPMMQPEVNNIYALDGKSVERVLKKHSRHVAGSMKGYARNFGRYK